MHSHLRAAKIEIELPPVGIGSTAQGRGQHRLLDGAEDQPSARRKEVGRRPLTIHLPVVASSSSDEGVRARGRNTAQDNNRQFVSEWGRRGIARGNVACMLNQKTSDNCIVDCVSIVHVYSSGLAGLGEKEKTRTRCVFQDGHNIHERLQVGHRTQGCIVCMPACIGNQWNQGDIALDQLSTPVRPLHSRHYSN